MRNKNLIAVAAATLSAFFIFIALGQMVFVLGLIALVPLFISVFNNSAKQNFKQGFIFGIALSCFSFYWMISGAERFTGYNFLYGAGVFLISALFTAIYWSCLLYCIALLKKQGKTISTQLWNCVIAASVFCVFEFLLSFVTQGFPWFSFYAGCSFVGNLYSVQPASFLGLYILSFFAVIINYLLASFIAQKQWKLIIIPVAIVLVYISCGYLILQNFNNNLPATKPVSIAVLAENIPPDIRWNDANGDMLVHRLLDLNKAAVAEKPDIILWSESAIPWTYKKDDDLVNEILKESAPAKATHILGINTEVENNIVNNSAYCILPNGNVAARYDKQFLLSLIEKPLSNFNIPFFSSKGFIVSNDSAHSAPLPTPYGKAGIMICNETACPASAGDAARKGAQFLCNMSNDGWFSNTYIVTNHLYTVRLRAVESRKDVVINCNNGYSGLISADGNIVKHQRDTEPFIIMADVHPNNYKSVAIEYPYLFVYVCAGFLVFIIAGKIVGSKKKV